MLGPSVGLGGRSEVRLERQPANNRHLQFTAGKKVTNVLTHCTVTK